MDTLCINNQSLEVKEWNGRRVVTFKDVDRVHQRKPGTARTNFKNNRKHFIANVDYFLAKPEDKPMGKIYPLEIPPKGITLLTETGYLMLVKSFTDDIAWNVQRELVNSYFRPQLVQQQLPVVAEEPKRLFWGGVPVMTAKQACEFAECWHADLERMLTRTKVQRCVLKDSALAQFKRENNLKSSAWAYLILHDCQVKELLQQENKFEQKQEQFIAYFKPKHNSNLTDEQMRLGIEQARMLMHASSSLKDQVAREFGLKAATVLLINLGLWGEEKFGFNGVTSEWDINSHEGWNKMAVLLNAKQYWNYE